MAITMGFTYPSGRNKAYFEEMFFNHLNQIKIIAWKLIPIPALFYFDCVLSVLGDMAMRVMSIPL